MSSNERADGSKPAEVDRLIHEPARYNIMALLYVIERADFLFVQNHTRLTPGNLSAHLSKLEAAGYVRVQKKFVRKKPKTLLNLTAGGKIAFEDYRRTMTVTLATLPEIDTDRSR
ncbi:MAG: transcriptional regulator [bacterium]